MAQAYYEVSSHLAYYNQEDNIIETDVEDTGLLLRQLYPHLIDESAGLMSLAPPLRILHAVKIDPRRSGCAKGRKGFVNPTETFAVWHHTPFRVEGPYYCYPTC
jgi:hypothetical protein